MTILADIIINDDYFGTVFDKQLFLEVNLFRMV